MILGAAPGRIRATTPSAHVRIQVNGRSLVDGPATSVVIANGQFFDGLDVVPRGHPGDGRLEVQVYSLRRGERRAMRARLPQGVHVPHPRIATTTGRLVEVHIDARRPPADHRRCGPGICFGSDRRGDLGGLATRPLSQDGWSRIPTRSRRCQYPRRSDAVRGGELHLGRTGHPASVLHERRRPGVRTREPARGREGRAVRAVLALGQEPASPLPRRVRRRARRERRHQHRRERRHEARRGALRPDLPRVRRRLRRAARWCASRVRAGVEPVDQGARVGSAR